MNTPVEELDTKETIMHYNAVLLEEQNSKFQLVMERMDALDVNVNKKIQTLSKQVDQKILALDHKIDVFGEKFDRKIEVLRDDLLDMERRICSKINRITDRCERQECRMAALEANQ